MFMIAHSVLSEMKISPELYLKEAFIVCYECHMRQTISGTAHLIHCCVIQFAFKSYSSASIQYKSLL